MYLSTVVRPYSRTMFSLVRFNKVYFLLTVILLCVEILIARYLHDRIIRPYIGDVLVVILIYAFIKSFVDTPVLPTVIGVFIFACLIEISQYFNLVTRLGLQEYPIARTIMGTSFEWMDIVAYAGGITIVLLVESLLAKKQ